MTFYGSQFTWNRYSISLSTSGIGLCPQGSILDGCSYWNMFCASDWLLVKKSNPWLVNDLFIKNGWSNCSTEMASIEKFFSVIAISRHRRVADFAFFLSFCIYLWATRIISSGISDSARVSLVFHILPYCHPIKWNGLTGPCRAALCRIMKLLI